MKKFVRMLLFILALSFITSPANYALSINDGMVSPNNEHETEPGPYPE
ncbi:hypothetical protein [Ornithinibacillus halotolerans]|uniref:Phr family secreted Rap phosphatase inhibitor n=1 Tax=Ornithinibacillus halotolerans TaxID=1274357 RepID=A0A916SA44_9BACI|nr:hypothetical protein [Ornithinibacillus halotolerans]GGA91053.1 hypothetical protein GCM10008025_36970 [Ornithinibacillus halotolerans]